MWGRKKRNKWHWFVGRVLQCRTRCVHADEMTEWAETLPPQDWNVCFACERHGTFVARREAGEEATADG